MPICPKPKTIRLKGKAYTEFRRKVYDYYNGVCTVCGCFAPLMVNGRFDRINCGHIAHIKSRGAGGGDTLDNALWKCNGCHIEKEHGPKWSKGEK